VITVSTRPNSNEAHENTWKTTGNALGNLGNICRMIHAISSNEIARLEAAKGADGAAAGPAKHVTDMICVPDVILRWNVEDNNAKEVDEPVLHMGTTPQHWLVVKLPESLRTTAPANLSRKWGGGAWR
jgi:hypothetical protein